ncbi:MAG: DUF4230 domain-containing protein [Clostridia bacterium]|nr:DUF4230 domain-containing protein [Clostridia bacterium]
MLAKILKTKVGKIVCAVIALALIITIVAIASCDPNPTVTLPPLLMRLEEASELTTANLTFTTMSEFKDSGIAIINKSNFIMVFEATARIGIDIKDVEVDADNINKIVWITIPTAKVLDVDINYDSIKYFDEKFSLFNFNKKEDANEANKQAEAEAKKELEKMGALKMADDQSEALIKGLIEDLVPDNYTIKVKKK